MEYTLRDTAKIIKEIYNMDTHKDFIRKQETDLHSTDETKYILEFIFIIDNFEYTHYYIKTTEHGEFEDTSYSNENITRENISKEAKISNLESNYVNLWNYDELYELLKQVRRGFIIENLDNQDKHDD